MSRGVRGFVVTRLDLGRLGPRPASCHVREMVDHVDVDLPSSQSNSLYVVKGLFFDKEVYINIMDAHSKKTKKNYQKKKTATINF
jgi:hypothetical protein